MDYKNFCWLQNERHELFYIHEWPEKAGITLNRKMLSEIAINDPAAFTTLCEKAKAAL